jgi:hypothetical protein
MINSSQQITTPESDEHQGIFWANTRLPQFLVNQGVADIPPYYGLKGGAARAIAFKTLLGIDISVRDVDLFTTKSAASRNGFNEEAALLAERYMPEDYSHGDGVDVGTDIYAALKNREFTMNEVAYMDGRVYYTPDALEAMEQMEIKLTKDEKGRMERQGYTTVDPKLLAKAQLFAVALESQGFNPTISEDLASGETTPFWAAVMLSRARFYGPAAADELLKRLRITHEHGEEMHFDGYEDAKFVLSKMLYGFTFPKHSDPFEAILNYTDEELDQIFSYTDSGARAKRGANWLVREGWRSR